MSLVIAHAGHWLVQIVYATPLIVMLGFFTVGYFRQRRDGRSKRKSQDEPPHR
jgi:hypothetical protein